jgi:hypothetical protein
MTVAEAKAVYEELHAHHLEMGTPSDYPTCPCSVCGKLDAWVPGIIKGRYQYWLCACGRGKAEKLLWSEWNKHV